MPKDAQVLLPLYEASLRLAAGTARPSEAAELLALTTSVATLLPTLDLTDDFRGRVVRQAKITEAGALRLQGDTNGALAILRALTDAHEEDAHVWSLIHDVHVGRGEHARAKEAREKALAHAKSDGHTARKLGPRPQPFR
jgi:predicted Zn-dependent protease